MPLLKAGPSIGASNWCVQTSNTGYCRMSKFRRALIALCASAAAAPFAAAAEPAKLVAGTITCKGKGTVGFIIGSKQKLACTFKTAGGKSMDYTASINKWGLDIGATGENVIVWTVLASTTDLPVGALAGKYAGVSADASLGLGAGANILIGGSKNAVTLQPLSVQGQKGINLAVGVSGLTLKAK